VRGTSRAIVSADNFNVMRFHDYHLHELSVHENGTRIVLTLSWDYPGEPRPLSVIEFSGVVCYRFSQTGGAIITEIKEMNSEDVARDEQEFIISVARADGLKFWNGTFAAFFRDLRANKIRAFGIQSAVGFSGFILASELKDLSHNQSRDPAFASGTSRAEHEPRHR
jgi:hypothetical protein